MDHADLIKKGAVGRGPRALRAVPPCEIPAHRQSRNLAHQSGRLLIAMRINESKLNREAVPKMSAVFFSISRSMRRCSRSRRNLAFSEARSDGDGDGACIPLWARTRLRKTVSCNPNSAATDAIESPLVLTRPTASRLSVSGKNVDYLCSSDTALLARKPVMGVH